VFSRLREFVRKHGPDFRPALFEALLLVAASVFRERGVTVAVYEAAIGGANDATSFLPSRFSVVTSVDLDHQNELGHSIEEIAEDKAGIAPRGRVLVLGGGTSERVRSVVREVCRRRDVRFVQGDANAIKVMSSDERGQTVRLVHETGVFEVFLPLPGSYQVLNCAAVWALTQLLHESGHVESLDAIRGIERARIRGRFELVSGSPSWLLDVAHNPASVEAVLRTTLQFFQTDRLVAILGATEPHDYRTLVRLVCERGIRVGVCEGFPRAIPAHRLAAEGQNQVPLVGRFGTPVEAIDFLRAQPGFKVATVLVTGSLLLVGKWRHELVRRGCLPNDE
jgi:dihydrofolate synthase/folylpolyglutamate synthase